MYTVGDQLSPPYNPPSIFAASLRPCSILSAAKIPFVVWDAHHLRFTPTLSIPVSLSRLLHLVIPSASLPAASEALRNALPQLEELETTPGVVQKYPGMLGLRFRSEGNTLLKFMHLIPAEVFCYDGRRVLLTREDMPDGVWVPTLAGFVDALISTRKRLDDEDARNEKLKEVDDVERLSRSMLHSLRTQGDTAIERPEKWANLEVRKDVEAAVGYLQVYAFKGLRVDGLEKLPEDVVALGMELKEENRQSFFEWFLAVDPIPDRDEEYKYQSDSTETKVGGRRERLRNRNRNKNRKRSQKLEERLEDSRSDHAWPGVCVPIKVPSESMEGEV